MAKKKVPNRQKTPPRKPKQQWHLSDRAKKGLIIGAAAVVLIVIIWTVIYNMSALRLDSEGKVSIPEGQNWLIYNEKTTSNPRYIKLGEVEPAEGYVLDRSYFVSDQNEPVYYFKPESDAEQQLTYGVMAGKKDYKTLAENTLPSVSAMLIDTVTTEIKTTKLSGRDVAYYIYTGGTPNDEDAEKVEYYTKQMNAYISAANGRSVIMMLEQRRDTAGDFIGDEAYEALLEKAIAGLK